MNYFIFITKIVDKLPILKMEEKMEFDVSIGGTEHLPHSANSLKFAASRSVEIAAMTESLLNPNKSKLIFQSLPVHMRRRVMSHNCKRLPRRLRVGHLEQLKKSGFPPKQKRPSRKYRRRPANLLEEYNRRQKQNIWLETHIWHAKRFHMTNRWGYRLPNAPCDKAFRACYRASSAHCLLQDTSYHTSIQIQGTVDNIKDFFSNITNTACGLSIGAKAYTNGKRRGEIHLYQENLFPFGYIGKAQYLWEPSDNNHRTLWLFVHPSFSKQLESIFIDILHGKTDNESAVKKRKITHTYSDKIQIKVVQNCFNQFRLTGPNSHAVLSRSLKCIEDLEIIKNNAWVQQFTKTNLELHLKEKSQYWKGISSIGSPSQLPSHLISGLIVRDPRLMRPSYRTKAKIQTEQKVDQKLLIETPPFLPTTPLWSTDIHKAIKSKIMTNGQFIEHVTKLNLVPGEVFENDPAVQSVPVVLIQRPGSQDPRFKKLGYGSGWDVMVPAGYGIPFWLTFIMFGARSGGLRETESLAFEMGECFLPPDSDAGRNNEDRIETELKESYFRKPPSKRVNYLKLGINSPFYCPWKLLLKDWCGQNVNSFYLLRDWRLLDSLQECLKRKQCLPPVENAHLCLVAVYLQLSKGNLHRHALITIPKHADITAKETLFEPQHEDPNEKLRKTTKREHIKTLKKLRRSRIKLKKKKNIITEKVKRNKQEPSDYVKRMRELWLPSTLNSVRNVGSRETMGYVSQGAFSFTEAHPCGVGYVAYKALDSLLQSGLNQVLVRNTTSRTYRLANIQIIKNV